MRHFVPLFTAVLLAFSVDAAAAPAQPSRPAPTAAQRIEITVGSGGFTPALTRVKVGQPVTLVVTRKIDETCATEIVIKDFALRKELPLNKAVEVTFTPKKRGAIRFACAMNMVAGQIVAE